MPTDASFRFSTYLTLALACVVVGYAESELLPEVAAFAALAVAALGVLFFLESRVAFLSIPAANRLGMAVGLFYLMWAAYRVRRELDTGEFANTGWHMFLVAMFGPFVMLLIVAKVARGDKHAGDYWALHGVALAGVGLAAALAEQPLCFALVGLYLAAAVWSLALLHLGRARGAIPPIPGGRQPATKSIAVTADPTGHRTDLRPALLCTVAAVAVAVPLYLITPRSEASKADFGKPRIEIGYAADQMVDLNRTGPLATNTETAFEFTATFPDGSPKADVSPDQRWRGKTLRQYSNGEWKAPDYRPPAVTAASGGWHPGDAPRRAKRTDEWAPPVLGPGQFTIAFEVPARLRGLFVADPVAWAPDQPPPLANVEDGLRHAWMPLPDGSFFWDPSLRARGGARNYVQAVRAGADPDVGPAFRFTAPQFELALAPLRLNPVPRVKEFADGVLDDLIRAGALPADCRDERSLQPKPEYREAVARKFAARLATDPALEYTTDLRRENLKVDPIEDFLFHSKVGHCERYATALVLMLRSQDIPAALVLGFKGCEHVENGRYLVRQEFAHAWVEALVPKAGEPVVPGEPLSRVYHWRLLDPTPDGSRASESADRGWLTRANSWFETRFQAFVKDYTPEQRRKAVGDFFEWLIRPQTLAWFAAVMATGFAVRAGRRWLARRGERPAPAPESARWFGELVALLGAHGITATLGDTPREFALAAASALRQKPACAATADVPLAWAEAYYQDRFGGLPPTAERREELDAGLTALRAALAQ